MKKLNPIIIFILCLCLAGCGSKGLSYEGNLGLDFSKSKTNEVVFNAYHSNTENHTWEQIASFTIEPKSGKYYDMLLKGENGKIVISVNENHVVKDNSSEAYESEVLGATETFIEEFKGNITGSKSFEVANTSGEQLYKLFPINNNGENMFYSEVSLDKPYDTEGENLDNILITVEIK